MVFHAVRFHLFFVSLFQSCLFHPFRATLSLFSVCCGFTFLELSFSNITPFVFFFLLQSVVVFLSLLRVGLHIFFIELGHFSACFCTHFALAFLSPSASFFAYRLFVLSRVFIPYFLSCLFLYTLLDLAPGPWYLLDM
jgi:hypothetical protein